MAGSCWEPINWLAFGCELNNNETMFLELSIAGIFAIAVSIFFYRRQNSDLVTSNKILQGNQEHLAKQLFELEHHPKLNMEFHSVSGYKNKNKNILQQIYLNVEIENMGLSDAIISGVECTFVCNLTSSKQPLVSTLSGKLITEKPYFTRQHSELAIIKIDLSQNNPFYTSKIDSIDGVHVKIYYHSPNLYETKTESFKMTPSPLDFLRKMLE